MSQYMTFKGNRLTKYWDVPKFQNLWQNLLKSIIIFKNLFPRNVPILPKSANAVMCPPGICSIALMLIHFQTAKDNKRESGFRWSCARLGFSPYQSIYQFGMTKRGRVHVSARVDGKRVEESSGRSWSSVALVLLLAGIAGYINSAHVSRWGWYTCLISAIGHYIVRCWFLSVSVSSKMIVTSAISQTWRERWLFGPRWVFTTIISK